MAWSQLDVGAATFGDGGAGHTFTYPGGAPGAGELLIMGIASDTTVTTPTGWTLRSPNGSDVQQQGAYLFFRVTGAAEPGSVVVTSNGDHATALAFARYAGNAASPFDVDQKAAAVNAPATSSPTLPGVTLASTGELCVAALCLHGESNGAATGFTPSAGYATLVASGLQSTGTQAAQVALIGRTDGSGAQAPSATWTNAFKDRTTLFAAFTQSASGTVTPVAAAGTLTPAGTLTRRVSRSPGGALGLSGALTLVVNPITQTPLRIRVDGRRPSTTAEGEESGTS